MCGGPHTYRVRYAPNTTLVSVRINMSVGLTPCVFATMCRRLGKSKPQEKREISPAPLDIDSSSQYSARSVVRLRERWWRRWCYCWQRQGVRYLYPSSRVS